MNKRITPYDPELAKSITKEGQRIVRELSHSLEDKIRTNERIFELAKQADIIQWDTLPSGARTPDHESVVKAKKFAELIVKECAVPMITQARAMDAHGGYKNNPVEVTAMNLHQGLLKHFGVEE